MGLTAFDTGVLFAFLDGADAFHDAAVDQILTASNGEMLLPAVGYAELAVGFLAAGASTKFLDDVLDRLRIRVGCLDQRVSADAARLRSLSLRDRRRRQWRMPDVMVVAEALASGASVLVTTDSRWPAVPGDTEVRVLSPSND